MYLVVHKHCSCTLYYNKVNQDVLHEKIRQLYDIPFLRNSLKKTIKSGNCKNATKYSTNGRINCSSLVVFYASIYIRVDFIFGSLHVTVERHNEKRWRILFTYISNSKMHLFRNSACSDSRVFAIRLVEGSQ